MSAHLPGPQHLLNKQVTEAVAAHTSSRGHLLDMSPDRSQTHTGKQVYRAQ